MGCCSREIRLIMIDCKQLPIPKYKVGDKVWIVDYLNVKEVEIDCVEIKVTWFNILKSRCSLYGLTIDDL